MPAARRKKSDASFLHHLFGGYGGAALVFALSIFSASPVLHDWLHAEDSGEDDSCAVVLFASGVALPLGAIAVTPPPAEWRKSFRAVAREIFLVPPRYLRQPERGPPVGWVN